MLTIAVRKSPKFQCCYRIVSHNDRYFVFKCITTLTKKPPQTWCSCCFCLLFCINTSVQSLFWHFIHVVEMEFLSLNQTRKNNEEIGVIELIHSEDRILRNRNHLMIHASCALLLSNGVNSFRHLCSVYLQREWTIFAIMKWANGKTTQPHNNHYFFQSLCVHFENSMKVWCVCAWYFSYSVSNFVWLNEYITSFRVILFSYFNIVVHHFILFTILTFTRLVKLHCIVVKVHRHANLKHMDTTWNGNRFVTPIEYTIFILIYSQSHCSTVPHTCRVCNTAIVQLKCICCVAAYVEANLFFIKLIMVMMLMMVIVTHID